MTKFLVSKVPTKKAREIFLRTYHRSRAGEGGVIARKRDDSKQKLSPYTYQTFLKLIKSNT